MYRIYFYLLLPPLSWRIGIKELSDVCLLNNLLYRYINQTFSQKFLFDLRCFWMNNMINWKRDSLLNLTLLFKCHLFELWSHIYKNSSQQLHDFVMIFLGVVKFLNFWSNGKNKKIKIWNFGIKRFFYKQTLFLPLFFSFFFFFLLLEIIN